VRADHFSLHGYSRQTTPHLERWAESATVFERAMSTSPWTLPSHASMLTGHWAHELSATWETALGPEHRTLAEALGARGYLTGGFVANTYYCGHELGLARGFAHYEDYVASWRELAISASIVRLVVNSHGFRRLTGYEDNLPRRSAEAITEQFLHWQSTTGARPFFAFLNYFDAHETYLPPPPFDTMFGPGPPGGSPAVVQDLRRSLRFDWQQRPRGEIDAEINMYDGAIAYLDQQLDRLFRMLEARGVLDDTIVIVTSDHGEQFGEHELFLHGNSLYQPLLHVPLLIRYPSRMAAGVRVADRVSLRDLPATIEDLIGGTSSFPGRSLARDWSVPAGEGRLPEPALAEVRQAAWAAGWASAYPVAKGDMASISDDAYHYIRNGDGSEELYAAADREEHENLAGRQELRPLLERYRAMLRDAGLR
jgi:arylsulfatase A-like enzyme